VVVIASTVLKAQKSIATNRTNYGTKKTYIDSTTGFGATRRSTIVLTYFCVACGTHIASFTKTQA
jgi:hypothetical protein